ncbi:hypothetical protein [Natrinema versiforme]|uniref:Uncharacterized protein n=1 Tax=Natrinema versiforme TaxID=88724 RepID=A0A4V1FXU3_9EURY|nr:hypothetical protein [Natrinema versiforme]QCS41094.1 hypothetical protein FEJ81_01555 [Natrinema versiforme]
MLWRPLLLTGLVYTAIFGSLSALVYWDANRCRLESPAKWAGFVFFSGGTGFLLYIVDSDDETRVDGEADPFSLPGSMATDRRDGSLDSDDTE